jgi:hypothetical protein
MNISFGVILLVAFGVMVFFGRARKGVPPKFMQSWIVGMAYMMACMVCRVMGVALLVLR